MMRYLFPTALLLAMSLPALADDATPAAAATINLQQPARIRVFSGNNQQIILTTHLLAPRPEQQVFILEGGGGMLSMLKDNKSETIGMPETFAVRALHDGKGLLVKPYYREFALTPGQMIHISADFKGNQRCVLGGKPGQALDRGRYYPSPSMTLTPEPGFDYELSFGTDGSGCGMNLRQILSDGRSVPLRLEPPRAAVPAMFKTEGSHLYAVLLTPGRAAWRLAGERADLQLLADDEAHGEAFETALRGILAQPGTQMCIVLPAYDYQSPLMARLKRVLDEQPKDFPAIYEQIDGMRRVLKTEDEAPTSFLAAATYCQLAGMMAFAPKFPLPALPTPADAPAAATAPTQE